MARVVLGKLIGLAGIVLSRAGQWMVARGARIAGGRHYVDQARKRGVV